MGDFWSARFVFSSNLVGRIFFYSSARIFFYYICAACNFFLPKSASACRKFFFKITHPPPPQELNCRPLTRRYCNAPALMYFLRLQSLPPSQLSLLNTFSQLPSSVVHISFILDTGDEISPGVVCMSSLALFSVAVIRVFEV